jgi:ArsR family transcriptional regulator, cadmium/lead-responsive transcriptional repressor
LLEQPEQSVPDLCLRTGLSQGRISVHLGRLLDTGVVQTGRRERFRTFTVADPSRVLRLLLMYREGLEDDWVERLLETWSELFRP